MFSKREYANKDQSAKDYVCVSTDTKPTTGIVNGSKLLEMDTSTVYVFDAANGEWLAQSSSGGGGGSSDFSTAQMTVNDSVDHAMYGAFAVGIVGPDDPPPTTTGKVYTDEYDSFSVVMYKGMAVVEFEIDEQTTISATGSATVDRNYVIITGDCTITIS